MKDRIYTVNEIRDIVAPIARKHGVASLYLFGSYARGEASANSDIDFLMDGGDGIVLSDVAFNRDDTGVWIRDAIVECLREKMARGERIELKPDGRIKVLETKEE